MYRAERGSFITFNGFLLAIRLKRNHKKLLSHFYRWCSSSAHFKRIKLCSCFVFSSRFPRSFQNKFVRRKWRKLISILFKSCFKMNWQFGRMLSNIFNWNSIKSGNQKRWFSYPLIESFLKQTLSQSIKIPRTLSPQ